MHLTVEKFVVKCIREFADDAWKEVLDLGSYDINGCVRDIVAKHFPDWGFKCFGVDFRAGPNVDHVSLIHEFPPDVTWPIVTCCEVLEHDPHWEQSLQNGLRLTSNPGIFIVTCAGPGRLTHDVECSPKAGYYKNLTADELLEAVEGMDFMTGTCVQEEEDTRLCLVRSPS